MTTTFPFEKLKKTDLTGKKLLIPTMHPFSSRLLAACLRGFGSKAVALPTYINLTIGKQFTSGKECFPCQVTISDIINFLKDERERLKNEFNAEDYVYFMPEADGPCRFGMYNKLQRIILNSFEDFKGVYVSYLTSEDSYSTKGIFSEEKAKKVKKIAYFTVVIGDVLDRILWRVRPYEKINGETEKLIEETMVEIEKILEKDAERLPFDEILNVVQKSASTAKSLIDETIERKPKIGIVGEIYLRSHLPSNQNIIKEIEKNGGEVVNASISEWVNFVTYENIRKTKLLIRVLMKEKIFYMIPKLLKHLTGLLIEREYQKFILNKAYSKIIKVLDIQHDHDVVDLEKHLEDNKIYSYEVGTEAALSIAGALAYVKEGFNGIVNVFPFSCMPSTITSAILKPMMKRLQIPYLDAPYDGTIQPNREIALKTFMFQAYQHQKRKSYYFSDTTR